MLPKGKGRSVLASRALAATKQATRFSKLLQVDVRLKSKRCVSFTLRFLRSAACDVTQCITVMDSVLFHTEVAIATNFSKQLHGELACWINYVNNSDVMTCGLSF